MDTSSIESYNSDDEINMDLEDYNYDTSDNCSIDDCIEDTIDIKVNNYTILTEQDVKERQENDITEISNLLQVSTEEACLLLLHYNWSVSKVHEEWYGDEEKVRKAVGIIVHTPKVYSPRRTRVMCGICFDYFSCDGLESAGCGHLYCYTCWGMYIMTHVNDGPGCLLLRCPEPKCHVAIGRDMIQSLAANEEDKERYCGFLLRSYVESNRKMKWCPAPGCELAVEFVIGSESCDVICTCSHWFCWHCAQEPHRPVDCEMVGKWILKNSSEAENTTWILANCKACPKCKRSIQKNHGCMHMTCGAPCSFQFCWLCLGDWSQHGDATGGYYACNSYTKNVDSYAKEERQKAMAKQCLERYAHYYERWASNNLSRQRALESLKEMETVCLEDLGKAQGISYNELTFVLEAWKQIVECRRVLKWTYTYGYYLHDKATEDELKFFQYMQGMAEARLEMLHSSAEEELMKFIKPDVYGGIVEASPDKFMDFRTKLAGLTRITGIHFDSLVTALENGLDDHRSFLKRKTLGL